MSLMNINYCQERGKRRGESFANYSFFKKKKVTCNSTSCKEIKPSHVAIFIRKQQFAMSINREIDCREGNVSEETSFGTLQKNVQGKESHLRGRNSRWISMKGCRTERLHLSQYSRRSQQDTTNLFFTLLLALTHHSICWDWRFPFSQCLKYG